MQPKPDITAKGNSEPTSLEALGTTLANRPYAHRSAPVSAEPIRVMLVDDHAIVRAGVRAMLTGAAPDVQIVGEATGGGEAVALAARVTDGKVDRQSRM